jgi:hypothetical protein
LPVVAVVCLFVGVGIGSSDADTDSAAQDGTESTATDQKSAPTSASAAPDKPKTSAAAGEPAAETKAAADRIEIGTWTVGVDIEPGTYRTAEAVTSTCYWGIYRSGSNGADIIQNGLVQGGYPTVKLKKGQDFENGCGVFVKQ